MILPDGDPSTSMSPTTWYSTVIVQTMRDYSRLWTLAYGMVVKPNGPE